MTVMVAEEAASGVTAAVAAKKAASAKKSTGPKAPAKPRPAKAPSTPASKAGGPGTPAAPASTAPAPAQRTQAPPASRRRAAARDAQQRRDTRRKGGDQVRIPQFSIGTGSAHRIVSAEFALCVVLVGVTPIVMRNPENGHVYIPNDFVRLSAVCLLFFVLALLSNNPRSSRFAAAFGGLVTLGVVYNCAQSLNAIGSIFVNSAKNKGVVATAAEGTETYDTATYTPGIDTSPVQLSGGQGTVST